MSLPKSLILALCGLLFAASPAASQAIQVTVQAITDHTPPVPVKAKIHRRTLSTESREIATTDGSGFAYIPETECGAGAMYAAIPVSRIVYQASLDWQQCAPGTNIVFVFRITGLTDNFDRILNGNVPAEYELWAGHRVLIDEISEAAQQEQWGVVAKLSSQLSAQYRSAGRPNEENLFAEVALGSTALYAAVENPQAVAGGTLVTSAEGPDADPASRPILTHEARDAIARLQTACGVRNDGIVGWRTMGCLPGGAGYHLPEAALTPVPSPDVSG